MLILSSRTHRHPVSSVPSISSLIKSIHQVYYENNCRDDAKLGKAMKGVFEKALAKATQDVKDTGLDCAHVNYEALVKDPIETVKAIYNQFGWTYTTEYDQILKNHLKEDKAKRDKQKQSRKGNVLHHYTPEEYSLTKEELSTGAFADYCKQYNVPLSSN